MKYSPMIRMVIRFGSVVVFLLMSMVSQPVWSVHLPSASLLPHDPIWILGDSGFTAANGVVSGSGTAEDPYMIEGWDVTVQGSSVFFTQGARAGILLENTRAHFVIRNVFVHDGPSSSANIVLKNASNGRVESSRVVNGNMGIVLWFAANNTVTNNEISGFFFRGVGVDQSSGNLIEANSIVETASFPIHVRFSSFNRFQGNVIEGAGGGVSMSRNSSFNVFQANTIRDSGFGVSVAIDSHTNLIRENVLIDIDDIAIGVGLGSIGNLVESNVIVNAGIGIILNRAFGTRVESNWISALIRTSPPGSERFTGKGVWVFESSRNWVTGNTIVAPVGIALCRSTATFLAPPPNDLSGSDRGIVAGPGACP